VQGTSTLRRALRHVNLCSVIANLELKMGISAIGKDKLPMLVNVSKTVSQLANLPHRKICLLWAAARSRTRRNPCQCCVEKYGHLRTRDA